MRNYVVLKTSLRFHGLPMQHLHDIDSLNLVNDFGFDKNLEFLKISQHSQENIHVGRDSNTDVFSVNIAKFLRTVFYRTRLVAASERINGKHKRHDFWSIFIPTLYVMIFYHINKFINVFLNTSSHKKNITKGIFLFEIIYVN